MIYIGVSSGHLGIWEIIDHTLYNVHDNECHVKGMFKLLFDFKLPHIYKVCMAAILPKLV